MIYVWSTSKRKGTSEQRYQNCKLVLLLHSRTSPSVGHSKVRSGPPWDKLNLRILQELLLHPEHYTNLDVRSLRHQSLELLSNIGIFLELQSSSQNVISVKCTIAMCDKWFCALPGSYTCADGASLTCTAWSLEGRGLLLAHDLVVGDPWYKGYTLPLKTALIHAFCEGFCWHGQPNKMLLNSGSWVCSTLPQWTKLTFHKMLM